MARRGPAAAKPRRRFENWREALIELAIVVVGILIALGLDQTVDALRERRNAAEAREAINAEVTTNITRLNQRIRAQACVDARLGELRVLLDGAIDNGAIVRPTWVGSPPRYAVEANRWKAASESGRVSLMKEDQQARLGFIYATFDYFYGMENSEQLAWAKLNALTGVDRLSSDGLLSMRVALEEAEFYNWSIRQVSPIILDRARVIGLKPGPRADGRPPVCWPMDLPYAEAMKRVSR